MNDGELGNLQGGRGSLFPFPFGCVRGLLLLVMAQVHVVGELVGTEGTGSGDGGMPR